MYRLGKQETLLEFGEDASNDIKEVGDDDE